MFEELLADTSMEIDTDCSMEFRFLPGDGIEFTTARDTARLQLSFKFEAFSRLMELVSSAHTRARALLETTPVHAEDYDDVLLAAHPGEPPTAPDPGTRQPGQTHANVRTTSRACTYVQIYQGCPMQVETIPIDHDEYVQFGFGGLNGDANILFDPDTLDEFMSLAHDAQNHGTAHENTTIAHSNKSVMLTRS